jgi:glycosyltransferase involved in cell wall biosynthesis
VEWGQAVRAANIPGRPPLLRHLSLPRQRGPAAARNRGWKEAKGDIIAFTDDDCLPHADWLRNGVQALQRGMGGVMGRISVPLPPRPTDHARTAAELERAEFATANCFYWRKVLQVAGGFDERFTTAWREDADLFFTLLENDVPLGYCAKALVVHPLRPAFWGISIREQRKSMFNALLYKKHPALYRARIQRVPPLHYYGIAGASFAAAASLGLALWSAGAFLAGVWLGMTGSFCMRRLRGTSRSLSHVLEMAATSLAIPFLSIYWRIRGAIKYRVVFF